jgi:hypothetical protein
MNVSLLIGSLQKQCTVKPSTQICFDLHKYPSTPKTEAVGSTKELVNCYQITWHQVESSIYFFSASETVYLNVSPLKMYS